MLNIKKHKKNIIQLDFNLVKEKINKSLEELKIGFQVSNYEELYSVLKKSKVKYRFLLKSCKNLRVFSKVHYKSYIFQ